MSSSQSLHRLLQVPFVIKENPSQNPPASARSLKEVLGNASVLLKRDPESTLVVRSGATAAILWDWLWDQDKEDDGAERWNQSLCGHH